ncbi:MAG TPA: hypothetical protein VFC71_02705 [Candidatus Polarisedimenticolia bacterium]|nr:hypothetical protein [Candidatus Polarisedimenticolia bacterium]
MYGIVVLIHIVAVLVFIAAHAVSAAAIFQVRAEPDRAKLTHILTRSGTALIVAFLALLVVLVAGIILGFMGGWWGRLWIWASLVVFVGVTLAMTPFAANPMRAVRTALGMQMGKPKEGEPAAVPPGDAELAAARAALRPELAAGVGVAGLILLFWLMLAKPF